MHEKCPNTEIFWYVFSRIWTKYGDLFRKSPYSVQMQENTDQKKNPCLHTFHAVICKFQKTMLSNLRCVLIYTLTQFEDGVKDSLSKCFVIFAEKCP